MVSILKTDKIQASHGTEVEVSSGHELHTDTLKGTTTAGSVTVQGEGTNTTNLQQGLAKFFFNLNAETFALTSNTFNITSATDSGTGNHSTAITNAMSDGIYSDSGLAGDPGHQLFHVHIQSLSAKTASTFAFYIYYVSNTSGGGAADDAEYIYVDAHGDLA